MKLKLCRCLQRRKKRSSKEATDSSWTGIGLFEPTATPVSAASGTQDQQLAAAALDTPASSAKAGLSHDSSATREFFGTNGSSSGAEGSRGSRAQARDLENTALRARLPNVSMLGQDASGGNPAASQKSSLTKEDIKRLLEAVPPGHYTVELLRTNPKDRYGFQWDASQLERCSVRVLSKVIPNSLADEYNKTAPLGCDIRVGDELVKVNGRGEKLEHMSAELAKRSVLCEFRPREPRTAGGMGEPAEEPPSVLGPDAIPTPASSLSPAVCKNALDEVRLDIESPRASQEQSGGASASSVQPSAEVPPDAPEETPGAPGDQVASSAIESRHESLGMGETGIRAPKEAGEDDRNPPGDQEQRVEKPLETSIEDRLQQLLHNNYGLPVPEQQPEENRAQAHVEQEVVKPEQATASKVPTEAQSLEPDPELPSAQADVSAPPAPASAPPEDPLAAMREYMGRTSFITSSSIQAPARSADARDGVDRSAPELTASPALPEEPKELAAPAPPEDPLAAMREYMGRTTFTTSSSILAPAVPANSEQVVETAPQNELEPVPAAPEDPKDAFWEQAPLTMNRDGEESPDFAPSAPPATDQRM